MTPDFGVTSQKGTTMQYMILIYGDEKNFALMANNPEAQKQMYAAFKQYGEDMRAAGVLRGGAELKPTSTATTVRVKNGKTITSDGPFAETKEQLGGYYTVDVPNLDEAVKWAARCPAAQGGSSKCAGWRLRRKRSSQTTHESSDAMLTRVIDSICRTEGARVLAGLIRRFGDFELAEDALQDAFAKALEAWPTQGLPAGPPLGSPL